MNNHYFIISILLVPFFLLSCTQEEKRVYSYDEIVIESPLAALSNKESMKEMAALIEPPETTSMKIEWTVPDIWDDQPSQGFRLATFVEEANPDAIDVSIVKLSGAAGGVQANIQRWMQQINIDSIDQLTMTTFLENPQTFITKTEDAGHYFDFQELQGDKDPKKQSILAAIIKKESETIFVKMTGTIENINRNRDAFRALNESLQLLNYE